MKPKRPKSRPRSSRSSDNDNKISHLHVVIDEELREGLEAHAVKLEGPRAKVVNRLNLSAAARDAMRKGLGLRSVKAA